MTTKRKLKRKLEALEESSTTEPDRIEMYFGGVSMHEPEPDLTIALGSHGFVVERDVQDYAAGGMVLLQTTPSAGTVFRQVSWYRDGPTADPDDVRIVWEADRLEAVRADAEYPTAYGEPEVPDETTVIDEGEGWVALVPSDRLITNTVERRDDAEYHGHEILGSVDLPLADVEEHDLVEVDTDPDADSQRRGTDE